MAFDIDECKDIEQFEAVYYEIHVDKSGKSEQFVVATNFYGGVDTKDVYGNYLHSQKLTKELSKDLDIYPYKKIIKFKCSEQDAYYTENMNLTLKRDENWYNGTNGGGKYLKGGFGKKMKSEQFITNILNVEYPIVSRLLSELVITPPIQMRDWDFDHIKALVSQIIHRHAKLPPVVILVNGAKLLSEKDIKRLEKDGFKVVGNDLILNGNHTVKAKIKAKKSLYTDCQLIPEKIWKHYTLDELIDIATGLNPDADKPSLNLTKPQWAERIVARKENQGIDIDSQSNKDYFKFRNIYGDTVTDILKLAKTQYEDLVKCREEGVQRVDSKSDKGKSIIKEYLKTKKKLYPKNALHITSSSTRFGIGTVVSSIRKDTGKYVCKLPEGKTRDIVAHIHIPAGSENDWYGYVKKYKDPKKPDEHITGDNIRNTEEIKTCLHHLGYRFKEFEIIDLKVPVVK
jgi:hypothetical protein